MIGRLDYQNFHKCHVNKLKNALKDQVCKFVKNFARFRTVAQMVENINGQLNKLSPFGINGPYFIKFLHQMRTPLLNLVPSKSLPLVNKLPHLHNLIKLYVLPMYSLDHPSVNDMVQCIIINVVMVGINRVQVLFHL